MDLDDFKKPEVAITAAAAAAILSPTVRHLVHRGAVYGVAGVLLAGRTLSATGHGVAKGFHAARTGVPGEPVSPEPGVTEPPPAARGAEETPAVAPVAPRSEEPLRDLLRKGAVYGATGARLAGDTLAAAGRGAARGLQSAKDAAAGRAASGTSEPHARTDAEHRNER